MSGADWLAVLVLAGAVILVCALDGLRNLEERRIKRAERDDDHRRLMQEIRRQP